MDAAQIALLCKAESFPHPVDRIDLIETHISWVILTGTFVYKIKKPLNFGFLDFSTLTRREFCCAEEVRLNRRAGGDLYLGVVPVCEHDGKFVMGGSEDIVDYAVQMRQFDPAATLAQLLNTREIPLASFEAMGYRIGAFHLGAEVAMEESNWGTFDAVAFPVRENFLQIQARVTADALDALRKVSGQAEQALLELRDVFHSRKQQGFIRELHGDLHAGNIALIDDCWIPFDCIEFNPNLRWIDTASDIAFLVMDLQHLGYSAAATRFLNAYLEYTGDYGLLTVLRFYLSYRAMVRAKVAILRREQTEVEADRAVLLAEFKAYLDYGRQLQSIPQPFVIMMMGVSGSGKSTIAKRIASNFDAIHIRSDAVRKRLFDLRPDQSSPKEMRSELYSEETSDRVFASMQAVCEVLLRGGYPVILDATFIKQHTRLPFEQIAQQFSVPLVILYCHADPADLEARIQQRLANANDPSEADVAVMRSQLQQIETCNEHEQALLVDTAMDGWEQTLARRIGR